MTLALLVYIVSNLAYNGTFFFWLGLFPLVLWGISYVIRLLPWDIYDTPIEVGETYVLTKDIGTKFKEGDTVVVTNIWTGLGDIRLECKETNKTDSNIKIRLFRKCITKTTVSKPKAQIKSSWLVVGALFMILHVVLPNRDTMIYCASAYMIQTVITNEKTQELSAAAYDATLEQLKEWSKESKDAAKLIAPILKEKLVSTTNPSK